MKQIRKITIDFIDHDRQRYETAGDYFIDNTGHLHIFVSKMKDNRHELLVGLHELIESILTDHDGVSEESISEFDIKFEKNRSEDNFEEPGDQPNAPYRKQHLFSTGIEKIIATELGVDWKTYDEEVMGL